MWPPQSGCKTAGELAGITCWFMIYFSSFLSEQLIKTQNRKDVSRLLKLEFNVSSYMSVLCCSCCPPVAKRFNSVRLCVFNVWKSLINCHSQPCLSWYHLPAPTGPDPCRNRQVISKRQVDSRSDRQVVPLSDRYLYSEVMSLQEQFSCCSSQRTPAVLLFWPALRTTDCSTSTLNMEMEKKVSN